MRTAASARGVTLIELVVVLIILSVGVGGLMQAYGFIMKSGNTQEESDLQKATNLAQSCALAILGDKRTGGSDFSNFSTFTCAKATNICAPSAPQTNCEIAVADPSGYFLKTITSYISATTPTASRTGCPAGLECLNVSVVARGATPAATSELSVLLAKYD
jgi:prepilin-type N-terminal cleavage/methylation domain-containing protein